MQTLEQQLLQNSLWLERYSPTVQAEIETKLKLAQEQILALVGTTQNKAIIQREVNKIMQEAFSTFDTVIADDIAEINNLAYTATSLIMADFAVKEAKKYKDVQKSIKDKLSNPNRLIQGHTIADHFNHLKTTNARKIQGIILDGYDKGVGIDSINRDIKNIFGGINRNQSRTIVRTTLLEASRDAQEEAFDYFSDEILGYRYSAKLDGRTSGYCLIANNYFTKDKAKAKYKPNSHYNCRSLWIPETELSREFEKELGYEQITQFDKRTVNHRDGTTSTKFTFDKNKRVPLNLKDGKGFDYFDEDYKRDYLGATRYKLYKEGKASLKEMVDISRNKLIPLEQLRKKI